MVNFKDEISPEFVTQLARELKTASSSFDAGTFQRLATTGLEELELKARINLIAKALTETMPASAAEADQLIRNALDSGDLLGWASIPINTYVSWAMLKDPHIALPLLAELTPRNTAEFAIRPFIQSHFQTTMAYLREWTTSSTIKVRVGPRQGKSLNSASEM